MRPNLIIYCALTLLILYSLAERIVPYQQPALEGCRIGYVYDGDTIEMICGGEKSTARLVGFDTPETKDAGCDAERAHGKKATERLRALVSSGPVELRKHGHDKYGRDLVSLTVNGRDVGDTLVSEDLATPYTGGTRIDWCARLLR